MPRRILFSTFLVGFAVTAPTFCVPPMEHILKEQLFLTHTQTSLLFVAPILMLAAVAIPAGLVADKIGVRKATGVGLIIMTVGAIMRGTATDSLGLLAFTFIYGFGGGWILPNIPKIASTFVQRDKATVVTGVISSGIPIGMALGLALTMPVIWPVTNSYQGVFLIWSIPVAIVTVLWWALVREPHKSSTILELSKERTTSFRTVLLYKPLLMVSALMFLHNFFVLTWNGWSPVLMMMKGASPSSAGLIASIALWSYIPAYILMPRLSYRLGVRKPFLWIPSVVLAIAAWGATQVSVTASWFLMALVGIANGTRFITLLALPVEMMHKREVGTASGIVISIGFAGGVVGPLIGGAILDNTQSLDLSFMVLMGASLAAAFLASRLSEKGGEHRI